MSIKVINVSDESWLLYDGVIPALDAGIQKFFEHESYAKFLLVRKAGSHLALLHSTLCGGDLWQVHVIISNLAIPISVNLLSK